MSSKRLLQETVTLSFERFWKWLQKHPNCILRVGTPEATLFDDEEYHWHFGEEPDGALLVQLVRGKRLVGEVAIMPADVTYVQAEPPPAPIRPGASPEDEEFRFECISETTNDRIASYFFVLSHAFDEAEESKNRWTH